MTVSSERRPPPQHNRRPAPQCPQSKCRKRQPSDGFPTELVASALVLATPAPATVTLAICSPAFSRAIAGRANTRTEIRSPPQPTPRKALAVTAVVPRLSIEFALSTAVPAGRAVLRRRLAAAESPS